MLGFLELLKEMIAKGIIATWILNIIDNFLDLARVDVSLEPLGLEGVAIFDVNPKRETKSLMTGYPLSFLWECIHLFKQSNKKDIFLVYTDGQMYVPRQYD